MSKQLEDAKRRAQELLGQIKSLRDAASDSNLKNAASGAQPVGKLPIKLRRTLKGHSGKIYSIHWAEDSPLLVSAGQDGVCLVWDTILNCKTNCYPLKCTWVMTCCFAPSSNFIACGGLDNNCSIFNLSSNGTDPVRELEGHQGHLSSCRFLNDAKILTSSGDKTAILWDLESGKQEAEFTDHNGDVMSVAISPDHNYFVTGSLDKTSKVYDFRTKKLAQITFRYHGADVNSVSFFPGGNAFASGSDDRTARVFDIRSAGELMVYTTNNEQEPGVSNVAFSRSGKYLLSSQQNGVRVWDTLKGEMLDVLRPHQKSVVSSMGFSGDGKAFATSSWDHLIKVLA